VCDCTNINTARSTIGRSGSMAMFRFLFVTIIPLEFWAIVLLLLFMWAAFGLWGMVATVIILAVIQGGRIP
jgi:hypothetical protein